MKFLQKKNNFLRENKNLQPSSSYNLFVINCFLSLISCLSPPLAFSLIAFCFPFFNVLYFYSFLSSAYASPFIRKPRVPLNLLYLGCSKSSLYTFWRKTKHENKRRKEKTTISALKLLFYVLKNIYFLNSSMQVNLI